MKTKYTRGTAIVVLGLAATLIAVGQHATPAGPPPSLIILKSNGTTVAELKLLPHTTGDVISRDKDTKIKVDDKSGVLAAKGGVITVVKLDGNSVVTLQAEEIEVP